METLKDDAKELAARQRALADSLASAGERQAKGERTPRDSSGARDAGARELADRTERIAEQISSLEERLRKEQAQSGAERAAQAEQHARESAKDMAKAANDYRPGPGSGPLTRMPGAAGTFSPTGIYGDATLATWAKGRAVVEARLTAILTEIEQLRAEPLPPPGWC